MTDRELVALMAAIIAAGRKDYSAADAVDMALAVLGRVELGPRGNN